MKPCINEALPAEVFSIIFEEHAKLEWRAPVIDGLVCRQWRRTILRSPRAWAHLEIGSGFESAPLELRQRWLGRSGTAPLHIRLPWSVGGILDQHYKRIKSLTVCHTSARALLENRSFPILESLTIYGLDLTCRAFRLSDWDAMPALRSLRICGLSVNILLSKPVPALRFLAICRLKKDKYNSIMQNSYSSLTTLMLDSLDVPNSPETLEFPSLTFLSLFAVGNLKHRMLVPALTAYHEASAQEESFPMPLPMLTEYGISKIYGKPLLDIDVTRLHHYYPNLSRISVRFGPSDVKAFLHSLSRQPTSLPMLRILAVEDPYREKEFSREDKDSMMNDVFVRNTATNVLMELCFDGRLRVPLYFGRVRDYVKESRVEVN